MTSSKTRFRPSPALVVSFVALFTAMSGAAMALPGQDTVNSGDVVNETLKSVDLKNGQAVATEDVIDQTLQSDDVALDTLTSQDLAANSVEADEIAAEAVGSAEIGADAVGSVELADNSVRAPELGDAIQPRYNSVSVNGGGAENGAYVTDTVTASCQNGEELISGSGEWTVNQAGDELFISEVILNHAAETVTVTGGNDSGNDRTLYAAAHCL